MHAGALVASETQDIGRQIVDLTPGQDDIVHLAMRQRQEFVQ